MRLLTAWPPPKVIGLATALRLGDLGNLCKIELYAAKGVGLTLEQALFYSYFKLLRLGVLEKEVYGAILWARVL
jgi:hypothetical protein